MRWTASLLLVAAVVLPACKRNKADSAAAAATAFPPFTQRFDGKNGLLTLHHPAGFSAAQDGEHSLILSRPVAGGRDEALSFVAVPHAISSDLDVFARKVQEAGASKLNKFHLDAQKRTRCAGNEAVEVIGTWVDASSGGVITRKSCAFLRGGHGYVFAYSIPRDLVAAHDPLLHAIVEATELK